ncbi:MAG: hypothetical protein RL660_1850 [Bacteroidota bacterium]|jgi:hypothetical protein
MTKEERYEIYTGQLDASLSVEEQQQFATLMQSEEFAQEYRELESVYGVYAGITKQEEQEQALVATIKAARAANSDVATNIKKNNTQSGGLKLSFSKGTKYAIGLAASLALIIAVYTGTQQSTSPQDLYKEYYESPSLSVERGTNDDLLAKITQHYNAKQYAEAIPLLESYIALQPQDQKFLLALAICKLNTNRVAEAEKELQAIIASDTTFKQKAEWYLALAYLKNGDKEKAMALLKSFGPDHFYNAKAKAVLKELS